MKGGAAAQRRFACPGPTLSRPTVAAAAAALFCAAATANAAALPDVAPPLEGLTHALGEAYNKYLVAPPIELVRSGPVMDPLSDDGLRYPISDFHISPAGWFLVAFSIAQRFRFSIERRMKALRDEQGVEEYELPTRMWAETRGVSLITKISNGEVVFGITEKNFGFKMPVVNHSRAHS